MQVYFDVRECARSLGVSCSTLARWRVSGEGPTYYKVGRRILYSVIEVETWVHRHAYSSTAQYTMRGEQ